MSSLISPSSDVLLPSCPKSKLCGVLNVLSVTTAGEYNGYKPIVLGVAGHSALSLSSS